MILLYGGSFNPPTIAHFDIAKYLINKYQPKAFIFIPVGDKYNKPNLIDFKHRYDMVKILANKLDNAFVSDYENTFTYNGTLDTLMHFNAIYKYDELYYVIGSDNLMTIDKWINYETLLNHFKFIVFNRGDLEVDTIINNNKILKQYYNSFIFEKDFKRIQVSATQYRDLNNDSFVLKEVNDYIYRNHLYNRGENI